MAKTDKITIEINKEIAKEAYEAGARWAFNDEDGILIIEGFETFWAKIESGLANADTGENNALLPDVSKRTCKNCARLYINKTAGDRHEQHSCLYSGNYLTDAENYKCDNWIG